MVLIKHNYLKSDIFFNPIFIPGFSGSRFFRVQVFQGPGFSGSGSRVQVQVLEVVICFACYISDYIFPQFLSLGDVHAAQNFTLMRHAYIRLLPRIFVLSFKLVIKFYVVSLNNISHEASSICPDDSLLYHTVHLYVSEWLLMTFKFLLLDWYDYKPNLK